MCSASFTGNFSVGVQKADGKPQPHDNFTRWAMGERPLWLNFADPTIINLHNTSWNPDYVVIPADYPADAWVYLMITAHETKKSKHPERVFFGAAHPVSYNIVVSVLAEFQHLRFNFQLIVLDSPSRP